MLGKSEVARARRKGKMCHERKSCWKKGRKESLFLLGKCSSGTGAERFRQRKVLPGKKEGQKKGNGPSDWKSAKRLVITKRERKVSRKYGWVEKTREKEKVRQEWKNLRVNDVSGGGAPRFQRGVLNTENRSFIYGIQRTKGGGPMTNDGVDELGKGKKKRRGVGGPLDCQ